MKNIFVCFYLILFASSAAFAENGSFFILKSTYFYQQKTKQGKKTLTRTKRAYDVIDLYESKEESLMFEIEFPKENNIVNGTGFIVETEPDLKGLGTEKIKVYPEIPMLEKDLTHYQLVPSNELSFTGRQEVSPDFPNLLWRTVNFKTVMPLRVWVPEWAGIYRPDKDADWLNGAYELASKTKMGKNQLDKILMGQIETGFTMEQVRMALGDPMREQYTEDSLKLEWIYNNHTVIFENSIVLRVL